MEKPICKKFTTVLGDIKASVDDVAAIFESHLHYGMEATKVYNGSCYGLTNKLIRAGQGQDLAEKLIKSRTVSVPRRTLEVVKLLDVVAWNRKTTPRDLAFAWSLAAPIFDKDRCPWVGGVRVDRQTKAGEIGYRKVDDIIDSFLKRVLEHASLDFTCQTEMLPLFSTCNELRQRVHWITEAMQMYGNIEQRGGIFMAMLGFIRVSGVHPHAILRATAEQCRATVVAVVLAAHSGSWAEFRELCPSFDGNEPTHKKRCIVDMFSSICELIREPAGSFYGELLEMVKADSHIIRKKEVLTSVVKSNKADLLRELLDAADLKVKPGTMSIDVRCTPETAQVLADYERRYIREVVVPKVEAVVDGGSLNGWIIDQDTLQETLACLLAHLPLPLKGYSILESLEATVQVEDLLYVNCNIHKYASQDEPRQKVLDILNREHQCILLPLLYVEGGFAQTADVSDLWHAPDFQRSLSKLARRKGYIDVFRNLLVGWPALVLAKQLQNAMVAAIGADNVELVRLFRRHGFGLSAEMMDALSGR
jgi:hypothetical protein